MIEDHLVHRDTLVSLASQGLQVPSVSLGPCREWERRGRLGTLGRWDDRVSWGNLDVQELQDRKVFLDSKGTPGLLVRKVNGVCRG